MKDTAVLQEAAFGILSKVLAALERAEIPALPVKGVVSARTLYDDPSERQIRDIDVRIRPRDYPRLLALAEREGWRIQVRADPYQNIVVEMGGLQIDFECAVGPPGMSGLTVEAMLARAKPGASGWLEPDPVDHALVMIVNVFKDKLHVAPWAVEDLRRIVRVPGVRPEAIVTRAHLAKNETMLWIVADWMTRIVRDEGWAEILAQTRSPRPMYAGLVRRLLHEGSGVFALRVLTRIGADDWRLRAHALASAAAWEIGRRRGVIRPAGPVPG